METSEAQMAALELQLEQLRKRRDELVVEVMTRSGEVSDAQAEVRRLRTAIEIHRDQTGHNLCWLNDVELWTALEDGSTEYPHATIVPPEEFFVGCKAFYESRFTGRTDRTAPDR